MTTTRNEYFFNNPVFLTTCLICIITSIILYFLFKKRFRKEKKKSTNYISGTIEITKDNMPEDHFIPILGNGGMYQCSHDFYSSVETKIKKIKLNGKKFNFRYYGKVDEFYDMQPISVFCIPILTVGTHNIKIYFDEPLDNLNCMFLSCNFYTEINLNHLDCSEVKDMTHMFHFCSNLKKINFGNINTNKLTAMRCMFCYCVLLNELDLSSFDTTNVLDMKSTFDGCSNLQKINLSSFNTSNVKDMKGMFFDCQKLNDVDLSKFDTSSVMKDNMKGMFMQSKENGKGYKVIPFAEKFKEDKRFQKVAFLV